MSDKTPHVVIAHADALALHQTARELCRACVGLLDPPPGMDARQIARTVARFAQLIGKRLDAAPHGVVMLTAEEFEALRPETPR